MKVGVGILMIFIILAMYILSYVILESWIVNRLLWVWSLHIVGIAVLMLLIAYFTKSGIRGLFLDKKRNRYSLSRVQIVIWTVLVFSAFTSVALTRNHDRYTKNASKYLEGGVQSVFEIEIPENLFWVLGISLGATIGSPGLNYLRIKRNMRKEAEAMRMSPDGNFPTFGRVLENRKLIAGDEKGHELGGIYVNESPKEARLSDQWTGEEVEDHDSVDLSKLQNLLMTLIVMGSFCLSFVSLLTQHESNVFDLNTLPDFSSSIVVLLGISHAGYLSRKGFTNSTPTSVDLKS